MYATQSSSVFEGILHIRHWQLIASSLSQLTVRRHCRTFSRRAFAVAGPTAWNSVPDDLSNLSCCDSYFGRFLKSILFSFYTSAHTVAHYKLLLILMRYINLHYLSTYYIISIIRSDFLWYVTGELMQPDDCNGASGRLPRLVLSFCTARSRATAATVLYTSRNSVTVPKLSTASLFHSTQTLL